MAYRRRITAARSTLFYQHRLSRSITHSPSISHSHRHHNVSENSETSPISRNPHYIQHRFLGAGNNFSNYRRFAVPAGYGIACRRNYSSETDKIDVLNEVVGVLGDKAVEVAPVANEVAVAAADSFHPVLIFQYLIDYVHCFTGLSWWASIAATTIIVRLLQLPFDINSYINLMNSSKINLLRQKATAIIVQVQNKDITVDEYRVKLKPLNKEYCEAQRLYNLKRLPIRFLILCSLSFAVMNMAKQVPSFKEGGALWFTDLTTPDSLWVLPVLSILTYCHRLELNSHEGMKGYVKLVGEGGMLAALFVSGSASWPKAIFICLIADGLFSVVYEIAMQDPQVKKLLGIPPSIPVKLPSTNQKSKEGGNGREGDAKVN